MPIAVSSKAVIAKNASSAMLKRRELEARDITWSIVRMFAAGISGSSDFNSARAAEASASGFASVCTTMLMEPQAHWA